MVHSAFILLINFFLHPDPPKFEAQLLDDKVSIGYGLAIGDVDGDRKPDILLADKKQFVWYRNGDWKRFVMVDNLTESDNVCIAARDLNGDGKVEVAVGAQWNPSETSDTIKSGAVFYLVPPKDPTQSWKPVRLHHEPVTHRMKWVRASGNTFHLVVLPLHGRGNKGGEGKGVKVFAYQMPANPEKPWKLALIDESMHLTHNLDVVEGRTSDVLYIGGKEGIKGFTWSGNKWTSLDDKPWIIQGQSFGELRSTKGGEMIAGIQPMHGNELTVYNIKGNSDPMRTVLADDFNQGHALAVADLFQDTSVEVVAGWREPNKDSKVGIKVFVRGEGDAWKDFWIDENDMACEDLQVADLNGDGKLDIIAAGRATNNLKVYWNRN